MKNALKISIGLNLCLLTAFAFVLIRSQPKNVPVTATLFSETKSSPLETRESKTSPKPFCWNDLVSTNGYQLYVANLRAIRCPESTIRAIVSADVHDAFTFKRQELKPAAKEAAAFSPKSETQMVAHFLADSASSPTVGNETPVSAVSTDVNSPEKTFTPGAARRPQVFTSLTAARGSTAQAAAQYPLVFQNEVRNGAGLSDAQKAIVQQVQQQFVDDVGGLNQDPKDPAYLARWQAAQPGADDALRGTLGAQAYMGYQLQHYYQNFQQVMTNAGDGPVTIDPDVLAR